MLVATCLVLTTPGGRALAGEDVAERGESIETLIRELGMIPLEGQLPRPFVLERLDGRRFTLADLGRGPALIYFWATW